MASSKPKIKVKYSNSFKAKQMRIKNLPKLKDDVFMSMTKRNARLFNKNFKEGIKQNSFKLEKLADGTIIRKRQLGMELPETPLYGKGDDRKKDSYINMLRIRKLKNGWKITISKQMHWSKKIKLDYLYNIHEFGALIKRGNGIVRIPARPAYQKAYEMTLKQLAKLEPKGSGVKTAINQLINTGKQDLLNKINERMAKQYSDFGLLV